jgi:hypothetical protein
MRASTSRALNQQLVKAACSPLSAARHALQTRLRSTAVAQSYPDVASAMMPMAAGSSGGSPAGHAASTGSDAETMPACDERRALVHMSSSRVSYRGCPRSRTGVKLFDRKNLAGSLSSSQPEANALPVAVSLNQMLSLPYPKKDRCSGPKLAANHGITAMASHTLYTACRW